MDRGPRQIERRRRAGALAATLVLALAGCARGPGHPPEPGDVAVATVGGQTVWASDVEREAVGEGLIGEGERIDVGSDVFRRVLDEVIDQKLLAAEALKRGLDDSPLAKRRLEAARERVLGDMLVESAVARSVNENAVRDLYQEQLKLAKPTVEYHVRQIVTANEADADAIKKLLAAGGAFEALAMERSTDQATRFNGGDLGYLATDVLPDVYAVALKTAKTGDVLGPFKADSGWVLLKVDDERPQKPLTLDEARPQIVRFLTYDQVRDLLARLRGQAEVKLSPGPSQGPRTAPPAPAVTPFGPSSAEKMLQANPGGAPSPSQKPAQPRTSS